MKIKSYKVYDFNELTEEAKKNAINKYYESEDYSFLTMYLEDELYSLDVLNIFKSVNLQYSLGYCQGDGLSFSCNIDFDKFIDNYTYFSKWKESQKRALKQLVYNVHSSGNTQLYYFSSRKDIRFDFYIDEEYPLLENKLNEAICELQNYYLNICQELEKYGYSIIEYRMDNEEFLEHCQVNNYTFREDGTMDNI